ncbi:MAG: phosphate ABC transporter substrate-binding protein PstS [Armatimonadetes bacterium]|nr:phosphate ABC transporter substrate-binding protein PstS [Armatimonadota bacterium]MDE2205739.1 phosphate ABC transporter substrate-binding protein PstS [Armatimonadota bacterium]
MKPPLRIALILVGAVVWALATSAASAQTIMGAGSSFAYPIYQKWFDAYHKLHPDVNFNYQPNGSGAGIAQYQSGVVDFGATDAPLTDAQLAASGRPTAQIPTVSGCIAMSYNLPNVRSGLRLSGSVIAEIYLGEIKQWNDKRIAALNPLIPLPNLPIVVAHRADSSGTTYVFTNYLASVSPEWKAKVGAAKSVNWPVGLGGNQNPGVAGIIKGSPGGFGYVELAYILQTHLPAATVENGSGNFVFPSVSSTALAVSAAAPQLKKDLRALTVSAPGMNTYPIVGLTYLLVPTNSPKPGVTAAMRAFLTWAMADGQQLAPSLAYAPLPPNVATANLKTIGATK